MIVVYLAVLAALCLTIGFGMLAVPLGFIAAGLCAAGGAVGAEWLMEKRKGLR